MKRCINTIVVTIALSLGSYLVGSYYTIIPTTVGDMSLVKAIQHYSNITTSYVNKWRPLGLWIIGASLRSGVVDSINNYIKVCKSLKLANYKFPDEGSLRIAFPINWTIGALCMALKNLKEQGMNALALVAQVNGDDVQGLDNVITSYLAIIDHNREILKASCVELMKKRMEKKEEQMKDVLARATIDEKKWKNATAKAKIVGEVSGAIDILKKGMETSVPTALLGAALYWSGIFNMSNMVSE